MKILARFYISDRLFAGSVITEVLYLEPDRIAGRVLNCCNDRGSTGVVAEHFHWHRERVNHAQIATSFLYEFGSRSHRCNIARKPWIIWIGDEMRWPHDLSKSVPQTECDNLRSASSSCLTVEVHDRVVIC